ncbi:MAG: NAD(P)-binding protein, partial [Oscillospiraceae bacterium]|nr:NAD(P)-binding protein [Oscillospiraceae bacterium]
MRGCKLLIVGAGAAGISAAAAAWDAGCRDILLVDRGIRPGGILPQCLHEGFGMADFGRELTG